MSHDKWEAEYQIEHNGRGSYAVAYIRNGTKKYIESCSAGFLGYGISVPCYNSFFLTIKDATIAAKAHAENENDKLKKGEVARYLGKLP